MNFITKLITRYYIKKHKENLFLYIICKEYENSSVYETIESRRLNFLNFVDDATLRVWW